MTTLNNVISVKNLFKEYDGELILEDINFTVSKNQFVSIIGQSGTGKSTIFDILCNLTDYKGNVFVDGEIGYVNQKDLLLPWLTIKNNIKLFTKLSNTEFDINDPHIKTFGLNNLLDKYPNQLSGGERQRASIYRNFVTNKSIWLLDEPFASLDLLTKEKMYKWLKEVVEKLNVSVLFISHDINETIYLSDVIHIIKDRPAKIIKTLNKSEFDVDYIKNIL